MGIYKGTGRIPLRIESEEEQILEEPALPDRLADIATALAIAVAVLCLAYVGWQYYGL
jgi:hypothetical protein